MKKQVAVILADGFEEMEGIIVIDILRRAGIQVVTCALDEKTVTASRNTKHLADSNIEEINPAEFDMIVLPGGLKGVENLNKNEKVIQLLKYFQKENKIIAAICAAPSVLKNHGILNPADEFTCFPGSVKDLSGHSNKRVVKTGTVITSKGPGSAFEFALYLVSILVGKEKMEEVKNNLQLPENFILEL